MFALTEDQELFRRTVREFAEREIRPVAQRYDQEERYPAENVARMAELGLMGITVPDQYGGAGLGALEYALAMEEVSRACAAHSVIMSVNVSLVCEPIVYYGSEEQKRRHLPALASARYIGAFCLSEPTSGSDAAHMATRAVRAGEGYVLDGTKNFITNGGVAGLYLVFAATDPQQESRGVSAFLVEADTPGLRPGPPEHKLGIRASTTTQVFFEQCRVPAANRLGDEGQGFRIAMSTLDCGRIGIAAQAVGIAQGAFELARDFVRERRAFGQRVADFQGIQWTLADMATRIEAARLLTYRAAALKDAEQPYGQAASMAKLYASETAMWVATKAIQLHGGYGYMREYP
ncbi:MAG: acyl-CoA dehydrogenase family protein, partial [Chloroflexi bacterium]|nr:acyl-CoA dehydrogenase family protein [Chloroflexota bacterium]